METVPQHLAFLLKLGQVPILTILVYISFQISTVNQKKEFKLIFWGWLCNLIHIIFIIPVELDLEFLNPSSVEYIRLLSKSSLQTVSIFFDLLGASLIVIGIRQHLNKNNWKIDKIVPYGWFILIGYILCFSFSCFYIHSGGEIPINPNTESPKLIIHWLKIVPNSLILFISYFALSEYFKVLSSASSDSRNKLLINGALLYAWIQFLPLLFEPIIWHYPSLKDLFETVGYTLGLISKIVIILGLHKLILSYAKSEGTNMKILAVKKDVIAESFHEIDDVAELVANELKELKDDIKGRYSLNNATKYQLDIVGKNNNHCRALLHSYKKIISKLNSDDFDLDIEAAMIEEHNKSKYELIKLNSILALVIAVLRANFKDKRIKVNCDYGGNTSYWCKQYDMYQLFKSILKNAFEAVEKGGEISISTKVYRGKKEKKLLITIKDNGAGISQKVLSRIFDRGFSTKKLEKNTWQRGMGLDIASRMAKLYNGEIQVISPKNDEDRSDPMNTVFKIYLPLLDTEIEKMNKKNEQNDF